MQYQPHMPANVRADLLIANEREREAIAAAARLTVAWRIAASIIIAVGTTFLLLAGG